MNSLRTIAIVALTIMTSACATVMTETNDRPIEEDHGRRSLGAVIDDQSIETTATVNIRKTDSRLEQANVNVVSFNGHVLLTGQTPDADLRQLTAQTAANVKNVKSVRNELTVGDNATFPQRSSDALLTTKVKSRLLAAANIKDSRVKVVTELGAVFLMGLVTRAEGDIAARAAQDTAGVQKVVLLFEYID